MDVFVIPLHPDRYELYCEVAADPETEAPAEDGGLVSRLRARFTEMLRLAEERRHGHHEAPTPKGWWGRVQDRLLAWVAERVAEQRLLWNLRRVDAATAAHPEDMTFDEVMTLIRRMLQRDYDRHRLWLVIDSTLFVASGVFFFVPGPNLVAYYFAFRVVGHWLSMRGASQGLHRVGWTGRACPPLTELREVMRLEPGVREPRIHDIAARLRLQHLSTFVERVAAPAA